MVTHGRQLLHPQVSFVWHWLPTKPSFTESIGILLLSTLQAGCPSLRKTDHLPQPCSRMRYSLPDSEAFEFFFS
jgi:hypothetical protein